MDLDMVTEKVGQLRATFGDLDIHYAVKANPMPAVLAHLPALGVGFDVASVAEIDLALAAGADPDAVVYAHPVKPSTSVAYAASAGVRRFAVQSESEVRKVHCHAPGSTVFVRLAVPAIGAAIPLTRKFGASADEVGPIVAAAQALGLHVDGVSFHVGSQTTDAVAWKAAFGIVDDTLRQVEAEYGARLDWVDIGGGLPAPHPGERLLDLAEVGDVVAAGLAELPWPVRLACEPGRFLVSEAGVMHTSVIDVSVRDGIRWVTTDTGPYHGLFEARAEGRLRFAVTPAEPIRTGDWDEAVIAGPTCDSSDRLEETSLLPPLAEGDRLQVACAGAYPLTTRFNGFDDPTTWVIDADGLRPGEHQVTGNVTSAFTRQYVSANRCN